MYKDKDKQREANRKAQIKFKAKGITKGITNQGITPKVLPERTPLGNIRVSKPGDTNYDGICHKDDIDEWSATKLTATKPKRGKDIKCFADLPPDVQANINRISESNEEKQKRTKIAISYQHAFPNRFHSTGVN